MKEKQTITFGRLLSEMPEEITDTNPSPKSLRENDIPVLISGDGMAVVYKSGYVYYHAVSREVVLNIRECWKFTYEAGKWICPKDVKKEDILAMDWYTVISLKGEEQAALNLENLKNDHKYRENIQETAMIERIPDTYDLEESLINKLYVQELLRLLTEREKRILILCQDKGYTQEEVAQMFSISQQAVSSALKRAKKQIQRFYTKGDE